MSEPISVSIPHRLGKEEALRRIQGGFGTMRAHLASVISIDQEEWSGNVVRFRIRGLGQNAHGSIVKIDVVAQFEEPGYLSLRSTDLLYVDDSGCWLAAMLQAHRRRPRPT